MALRASYSKRIFEFSFSARTSRGPMADKISWFIKIWDDLDPDTFGIGECAPLPGLSIDDRADFESVLKEVVGSITTVKIPGPLSDEAWLDVVPKGFPAIKFGIETALLDLSHGGRRIIFKTAFSSGKPIPINGLIWMGDTEFMLKQIDQKIAAGFTCIKLKVGGLDFQRELEIIGGIRRKFSAQQITIRLDANGAFDPTTVMSRLDALKSYAIHSIEQPIKQGLGEMTAVCCNSPIAVALDEELIGKETTDEKKEMLSRIKPSFIVLKPTLHGGLTGCAEWITLAEQMNIGWWITSALESNIGLNAICQFTSNYPVTVPQGLGTGMIYTNNIPSPLTVDNGTIFIDHSRSWDTGNVF